jgi:hypothetical protein
LSSFLAAGFAEALKNVLEERTATRHTAKEVIAHIMYLQI